MKSRVVALWLSLLRPQDTCPEGLGMPFLVAIGILLYI